jgi:hypothetical protein
MSSGGMGDDEGESASLWFIRTGSSSDMVVLWFEF